jgi:hypothetical protein
MATANAVLRPRFRTGYRRGAARIDLFLILHMFDALRVKLRKKKRPAPLSTRQFFISAMRDPFLRRRGTTDPQAALFVATLMRGGQNA